MRLKGLWSFATAAMLMAANAGNAQQSAGFDVALARLPPFPVTAFYDISADLSSMPAGAGSVRQEEIEGPAGAVAWRLIYVSETWDGRHFPASGLVIAPQRASSDPRKFWPGLMALWAPRAAARHHSLPGRQESLPTVGAEHLPVDIGVPFLGDWLNKGYVVVAPDYAGLGTNVGFIITWSARKQRGTSSTW